MASSSGLRPSGTDGRDFLSRQTIEDHYKVSAVNKGRLRTTFFLYLAVYLGLITRFTPTLNQLMGVPIPAVLAPLDLPPPSLWEWLYLSSILPAMCGFLSLRKNNSLLLAVYMYGSLLQALLPLVYGLTFNLTALREELSARTGESQSPTRGSQKFPFTLIWYSWMFLAVQVNAFGLYFARQLRAAWDRKGKRS